MMSNKLIYKQLSRNEWFVFLIMTGAAVLSFWALPTVAGSDGLLHVYFLDVGQGDAIFIQAPNGNQVLIDGGPDNKVLQELGKVMPFHDRSIDLLVLTHPDADHLNGLIGVLERYDVEFILENTIKKETPAYARWQELKNEANVAKAVFGQEIALDEGVFILILFPTENSAEQSKINNNSIVAKLVYGNNSLLLTGDIEAKVEKELAAREIDMDSDLLKISHHGSKTSTTQEFLDAVTPLAAFIQAGAGNRYGHPHPSVLERLENHGIKYYRTDIDGTIELILDGINYKIKN